MSAAAIAFVGFAVFMIGANGMARQRPVKDTLDGPCRAADDDEVDAPRIAFLSARCGDGPSRSTRGAATGSPLHETGENCRLHRSRTMLCARVSRDARHPNRHCPRRDTEKFDADSSA